MTSRGERQDSTDHDVGRVVDRPRSGRLPRRRPSAGIEPVAADVAAHHRGAGPEQVGVSHHRILPAPKARSSLEGRTERSRPGAGAAARRAGPRRSSGRPGRAGRLVPGGADNGSAEEAVLTGPGPAAPRWPLARGFDRDLTLDGKDGRGGNRDSRAGAPPAGAPVKARGSRHPAPLPPTPARQPAPHPDSPPPSDSHRPLTWTDTRNPPTLAGPERPNSPVPRTGTHRPASATPRCRSAARTGEQRTDGWSAAPPGAGLLRRCGGGCRCLGRGLLAFGFLGRFRVGDRLCRGGRRTTTNRGDASL